MSSSASRVLLVDDDEHLLTVAKRFLTQKVSSFDVVTTKSPHDALRLLGEQPFDAIVADYQMPKMNGIELLKIVRDEIYAIPFIMFTGRGHEEVAIQALNLGADYYLKKEGKPESLYTQLAHILDSLIAHKKTEKALQRSEYEKTLILGNASDAIVYYNCNLEILWANSVALAPIDEPIEEIIGRTCHIVWRKRDTPCEDCPVVKTIATGKPHEQELITMDGNIWKDRVFPVRDDSGSLLGAVEISLDITELKQANAELRRHRNELEQRVNERTAELSQANEELSKEIAERIKAESKLQKSEERYRFLFENAPIGIGISNAEGRVISANQQMQRMTGYTIDELKTIELQATYVSPTNRDRVLQALQETGQIRDWEIQLKRKDGSIYLAQLNIDRRELDEQHVFFTSARDITEMRHAEEVLQQSEQRFRQLVETMHDAFGIQDEKGLITYVNDRTCEMIGYSRDEMLGRPTVDFLDEINRRKFEEQLIRRREGERSSYELVWIRKDRSPIPTIMSSTPIFDANGQYKGSFAVITDITSQKQTEDALRESEERYRILSDAASEGIAVHEKGMILEANKAFASMFGYALSELIAKDGFELFAPESRGLARARILNGSEKPYEGLLVRKDGTSFPARIIGTNIKFMGRPAQIITIQDITYQAVVEDQTELVCRYLPGGILTFVNEAYCRYFGKTREALINHHFLPLIPEEDQEAVERQISLLTLENPVATYEHKIITPTGELAWQQWTDRAIFDDQGHIVEYQAVGRDITERKQIEAALQESEERYRTLTELHFDGIVIHDNEAICDINPAGAQIVGLTREEVIGQGLFDFLLPESIETVEKSMIQKQETPFEIVVSKRDGEQMYLEVMPGNCKYQGKSARIAAFRDVTERKKAEQQLKDSEERLRILFEYAPDGYYLHDLEGKLLDGNKAAEDITGYKREELIGKNILELSLMPEEQIPKAAGGLVLNMEGKAGGPEEFTILRKDGTQREVEIRTYPVTIKGQTQVLGIARDITERIQTETALRESEVKYKYLVDELQEELLIYQDNRVVFANRIVVENTGYSLEELYAFSPEETQATIHPDDQPLLAKRLEDRLKGIHGPSPFEYRRLNKDGAVRWIETEATLITYEGKQAIQATGRDITERKRSEKALRESEERFRAIFESAQDSIFIKDQSLKYTHINPAMEELFQLPASELLGCSDLELFGEEAGLHIQEIDSRVLAGEIIQEEDTKPVKGVPYTFHVIKTPLLDNSGKVVGLCGIARDITERKCSEEALRESEKRYNIIKQTSIDGFWIIDLKGHILDVNETYSQMVGYTQKELLTMSIAEIEAAENPEKIAQHIKTVTEDGYDRFETRHRRKDGTIIDIEASVHYSEEGTGKIIAFLRDITERKKAETGLLEREQRYRALFERTNDAVFILDLDLNHLDVNQRAADLLGYTKEELIGMSAIDMVAPQEQPEALKTAAALETQKIIPIYERTFRRKDGSEIVAELNVAYIEDSDGNPLHIQSVARDITERKQTEETLLKSEEKFRVLFEESPISLWEQDFSEIKSFFDRMRAQGVTDFRTYFEIHPESIIACARKAKITDVNKATLKLYKATSKEELTQNLDIIFGEETYPFFKEGLIRLAAGETAYESESINYALNGEKLFISLRLSVAPGYENTLGRIFASVINISERKEADIALRESEERFRTIFQESPIGIGLYDSEGNLIAANPASLDMIGVSNIADTGDTNLNNATTLSDENKMKLQQGETVRYQTPVDFDEIRRQDLMRTERTGIAYYDYLITPLGLEKEGSIKGFLVHAQDITERKQAEEALQRSEEQYRLLADHSIQGLAILQDERFVFVNPAMAAMYGETIEEMTALSRDEAWKIIHPDDRKRILSIYQDREKGKQVPQRNEYRIIRKDGQMRWVESFAANTTFEGKNAVQTTYVDITDRKKAELALKESEQRYRSFIQNFQGIAFQATLDFRPIFFHGEVEKITGYSESEFLAGMPSWDDIIHRDDLQKLTIMIERANANPGESTEVDYRIISKDNQIKWVLENIQIICDASGAPLSVQGVIYDITERKWAEQQLRRQRAELSEFAHAMAHDLRNSLLSIVGYSEMLKLEYDKAYTEKILQLTSQMNSLLRRSVILADAGLVIEKTDKVNLTHLVQEVASEVIPNKIRFVHDELPIVRGDASKLHQVFQNLLENAVVHGKPKNIEIRYHELLDRQQILVINDGEPIPKDHYHRVFDRKFSTKKEGGGLGLSIVKKLVEAHGWQIELEEVPKTTFRINILND